MKLSDTEWKIMNIVWRQSPASVRDVLEGVENDTGWSYSTVKTLLTRLVDKGVVTMRKRANTSMFEPCVSEQQARKSAIRSLLDSAFDGTFGSLIQHVAEEENLNDRDRAKLAGMLADLDSRKKGAS